METWYWSAFLYNSKFTLTSKKAWNKHGRYKEGCLYISSMYNVASTMSVDISHLAVSAFCILLCFIYKHFTAAIHMMSSRKQTQNMQRYSLLNCSQLLKKHLGFYGTVTIGSIGSAVAQW